MKKSFRLLSAALIALASFVSAQAADTLLVNDGTDTNYNVPIEGQYADGPGCAVQTIFPESQVAPMNGGIISSMTFYIADANGNQLNGGKLAVSVGVTAQNTFPSYNPSLITGLTHVADVTMTPGETEVVVNFDTPYLYEGGNLVVEFLVDEKTSNYAYVNFYGVDTDQTNACIKHVYSSSADSFYPKTTFEYQALDDMAIVSKNAIAFDNLYPEQTAEQTFTLKNVGKNAFTPVFSALQAPFSITPAAAEIPAGETVEYTVTFAPADLGDFAQTLTIDCGAAGQFEVAISGSCVEVPTEIVVCDGTDTDNYPVYAYYHDQTYTDQMIYKADMLADLAGKKISYVTFYADGAIGLNSGAIQLSFKAVDQDGFVNYNQLTDMTVVATVVPNADATELTFVLDEPYEYTGGNLAIEATNLESGNYSQVKFYGKKFDDYYPSLCYYGNYNSSAVSHFLPKAAFGYVKEDTPEPQGLRGDVNGDEKVDIDDATMLINYLLGEPLEINQDNANCDLEGGVDIGDATALINFLLNNTWDN